MGFVLNEEQAMLRDTVARFLAGTHDISTRIATKAQPDPRLWGALAQELGLLFIAVPADHGGIGGGAFDIGIVQCELGRALTNVPFNENAMVAAHLLSQRDEHSSFLTELIAGNARFALALLEPQGRGSPNAISVVARCVADDLVLNGTKPLVAHASGSSHFLTSAKGEDGEPLLLLVEAASCAITPRHAYDDGVVGDVAFDGVSLSPTAVIASGDMARSLLDNILARATIGLCAESVGVLTAMLDLTRNYALERKQFGVSVAGFQSLRHRFADMQMALLRAEAITETALRALDEDALDVIALASAAKVEIADAACLIRESAVQIHGAMGLTEEMAISHYFRRALAIEQAFGDADYHLKRYAELSAA